MNTSTIPPEELEYGLDLAGIDPASLSDALRAVAADAMLNPAMLTTWLGGLSIAEQTVGLNTLRRMQGEDPPPSAIVPMDDKRFNDPAWKSNPFLFGALEDYFVRSTAALQLVDASRLPEATRHKARFAVKLMMDALAPSNVPWMNPAVVKEAMNSGGASLVRGLQNYLDDVKNNGGQPRQVDTSGFKLGVNLAATPGRVVYRNKLIELIAYEPQTPKVHAIPLLCSPPWINKYYIMDLAPGRSFVEWAIKHGHQTFMISYRNPDESMAAYTMDDYLREGLLAAIDVVHDVTGAKKINLNGLCLGGTLVIIALAYLAAKGQAGRISSATVTNTLVDFSLPGDLGVFTDEASVSKLEARMQQRGYLEAGEMAGTFNALRANDLIWSYVVNNWFMGKNPPAFDILAWNGDSTRMPAVMHSQYLRACYLRNAIIEPGEFAIAGVKIDLAQDPHAAVRARRRVRSYRVVARELCDDPVGGRRCQVHADQLRARRGHRQSARQPEVALLDQTARDQGAESAGMARFGDAPRRQLVERLERMGRTPRRCAHLAGKTASGRAGSRRVRARQSRRDVRQQRQTAPGDDKSAPEPAQVSTRDDAVWKSLGEFIKAQRELANLSLRQLAELAKVSNPYLSQVERGLYKPSAEVLKNLANALHMSAETMYGQAGLLDEDSKNVAPHGVESAIKLDPGLSQDQKETLIRIYRGFTEH